MNFNTTTHRVGFVSLCLLSFVMTPIANAQTQSHEEFICTFGSDRRVVSLVKADATREPKSCRMDYTRNGETKTVWSSKNDYAYCTKRALALVTKLAQGNYSCKPETIEPPPEGSPGPR